MQSWLRVFTVTAILATGCSKTSPTPSRTDTTAVPNPSPASYAVFTPASVCDSVSARWAADSAFRVTHTGRDTVRWARVPRGLPVCSVTAYAAEGPTPNIRPVPSFWSDSTRYGWLGLVHEDADGPDGFSRMLQRGEVRCLVEYTMDGDDDSDSTYVPKPWIREATHCWRATLVAADTAH